MCYLHLEDSKNSNAATSLTAAPVVATNMEAYTPT